MASLNSYIRLIIIFLLLVMALLVWQGFAGFQQFKDFHQHLSERSVNSTSREILSLMQSIRDRTRLFSEQEHKSLLHLLEAPKDKFAEKELANKIDRYFPKHLTFAIANKNGIIEMKHSDLLIGATCRSELIHYASNGFKDNPINMHFGPFEDANHFDVLAPIISEEQQVGILFISFTLNELRRVLSHGAVFGHELLLMNKQDERAIVLRSSTETNNSSSNARESLYTQKLAHSSWELLDIPRTNLFESEYKRLFIQGLLIFSGFLGIGLILIWAIKRENQKCGNIRGLLMGVEDERRRIAMDMHDQVLSELSHLSRETLHLKTSTENPQKQQAITNITDNLGKITRHIRSIINNLHPHFLDIVGLEESIREHLRSHFNQTNSPTWTMHIDDELEAEIDKTQRFNLYRIILEIVNNIHKHANCTTFSINLHLHQGKLQLLIEDNGSGFDLATAKRKRRLGLRNVEMRAQQIHAQIRWSKKAKSSSSSNKGTRFELTMNTHE